MDAAPPQPSPLLLRGLTRYTADPSTAAWYTETFLGAGLRLRESVLVGANLPLLYVQDAADGWVGLGNTVAFADWQVVPAAALGLQLELPTTTRDTHDDAGHVVAFPYARGTASRGRADVRLRGGWGRTLDGGEDHEHTALVFSPYAAVNPHSDSELQLRAEAGAALGPARPALGGAAIYELDGAFLATINPVIELTRPQWVLRAQWEQPLTEQRRFARRVSLTVTYHPSRSQP